MFNSPYTPSELTLTKIDNTVWVDNTTWASVIDSINQTEQISAEKITLNGEDLNERLIRIEKALQMPLRDVTMEQKYAELKELANQYNNMLESLCSWDTLKSL